MYTCFYVSPEELLAHWYFRLSRFLPNIELLFNGASDALSCDEALKRLPSAQEYPQQICQIDVFDQRKIE